jgi:ATP-dependent exoDNAse (exonuclease V) beta subunit
MAKMITQDPEERLYRGKYPSVTTVLKVIEKPYLEAWRRRVGAGEADRVLRNAQVFGTTVHKIAHAIADAEPVNVSPQLQPFADAIEGFLEQHVDEVIHAERELVSEKHRFGGTLDLYARMKDGSHAVIDWKTNKGGLTREHGLQTAGYALLAQAQELPVNRRLVVRLKQEKPGHFYAREYKDHLDDTATFLALVQIWHWRKSGSKTAKKAS